MVISTKVFSQMFFSPIQRNEILHHSGFFPLLQWRVSLSSIWWSFKVMHSGRPHCWHANLVLIQNFGWRSSCVAPLCEWWNLCFCGTSVEYMVRMLLTARAVGDPLLLRLPAAWQEKQKSRIKLKQGLNYSQSTGEDCRPGYGFLAKGRPSFFARQKSNENGQINPSAFC